MTEIVIDDDAREEIGKSMKEMKAWCQHAQGWSPSHALLVCSSFIGALIATSPDPEKWRAVSAALVDKIVAADRAARVKETMQ